MEQHGKKGGKLPPRQRQAKREHAQRGWHVGAARRGQGQNNLGAENKELRLRTEFSIISVQLRWGSSLKVSAGGSGTVPVC